MLVDCIVVVVGPRRGILAREEKRLDRFEILTDFGDRLTVRSETTRSNQGNELAQTVRLKFSYEDRIRALDIIENIIGVGKEEYKRQLERDLAREQEGNSSLRKARQQIYFED